MSFLQFYNEMQENQEAQAFQWEIENAKKMIHAKLQDALNKIKIGQDANAIFNRLEKEIDSFINDAMFYYKPNRDALYSGAANYQ